MRIIGGRLKGRVLKGPSSEAIRPTSDRLRETLFNILAHSFGDPVLDARVIDVFAGTGALAIESLSRGAAFALLVDEGLEARALIRANVEALGLGGHTRILRRDALKLGTAPVGAPFALAFLDPPYNRNLAYPALVVLRQGGWLASGALVVVEEASAATLAVPPGFSLLQSRDFGETHLWFLQVVDHL